MSSPTGPEAREPLSDRLLSIDALRGFDMFWIMGAEDIAKEFAKWSDMPGRNLVDQQLEHVPWAGFHFYDLIFPLFLFLVGAVLPFSLGKLRERGATAHSSIGESSGERFFCSSWGSFTTTTLTCPS